jgi:hypothetical protein
MIFGGNALMCGGVGDKIECAVAQVKGWDALVAGVRASLNAGVFEPKIRFCKRRDALEDCRVWEWEHVTFCVRFQIAAGAEEYGRLAFVLLVALRCMRIMCLIQQRIYSPLTIATSAS